MTKDDRIALAAEIVVALDWVGRTWDAWIDKAIHAREASNARKAWVQFASSGLSSRDIEVGIHAARADEMLAQYMKRYPAYVPPKEENEP